MAGREFMSRVALNAISWGFVIAYRCGGIRLARVFDRFTGPSLSRLIAWRRRVLVVEACEV